LARVLERQAAPSEKGERREPLIRPRTACHSGGADCISLDYHRIYHSLSHIEALPRTTLGGGAAEDATLFAENKSIASIIQTLAGVRPAWQTQSGTFY
jgi:hypothetical protein